MEAEEGGSAAGFGGGECACAGGVCGYWGAGVTEGGRGCGTGGEGEGAGAIGAEGVEDEGDGKVAYCVRLDGGVHGMRNRTLDLDR